MEKTKTRQKTKHKQETIKKICSLLIKGFTNKEIAEHTGLSKGTINAYILNLLEEKQCANRTQLAVKIVTGA